MWHLSGTRTRTRRSGSAAGRASARARSASSWVGAGALPASGAGWRAPGPRRATDAKFAQGADPRQSWAHRAL